MSVCVLFMSLWMYEWLCVYMSVCVCVYICVSIFVYLCVLNKPLRSQRGQNMQLKMCWRILSDGSDDTKCNSTCVEQTAPQHVLTKLLIYMREYKVNLNMYWPKPIPWNRGPTMYVNIWWTHITYTNEDKKCIFYILLTKPFLSHRGQKFVSELEMTKPIPWLRGN